jgi:cytochrome c-type biogenesis protein CcmH
VRAYSCCIGAVEPLAALPTHSPRERDSDGRGARGEALEKLRCLVCQNQSIADSNAELAQDLRRQIHEQIAAGKTDDEIVAYMVARYGDFVLYETAIARRRRRSAVGRPALLVLGGIRRPRTLRGGTPRRRGRTRSRRTSRSVPKSCSRG